MRILAVTNTYPNPETPGHGTFIEQQIKGLRKIGLEVEVLFLDRLREGMRVYRSAGKKVLSCIEKFEPHIIHIMYGGVMADVVTKAAASHPTVVTFHGSDLLGENLSGGWRKFISRFGVYSSWKAAKRARRIIVVSKVLQYALPEFIDRSKVRIIPCGIDLDRFNVMDRKSSCEKLGWDCSSFHILFNGNSNDPVKRPQLARKAVFALYEFGVKAEFHEMRGVPNTEVSKWLNASDVVLLTSLHEGSPTIIKEALACNLPVVSVDVGDVRERVEGVEGCHIATPEVKSLAEKLILVYQRGIRIDGRTRVQELSLENVACRLVSLYKEII
ncbi:MAG: glycosyltransferase [Nitrospira sp.]|nr:glycosyltransferase [Nitrospira sp.]